LTELNINYMPGCKVTAQPGHFYAVGVGPGCSDLLTLRAAAIIASADVIITPQAKGSSHSLALEAIQPFIDRQEIIPVNYPMSRNHELTRKRWQKLAATVLDNCSQQRSVVQVTLGDPLIFATSSYLLAEVTDQLAADQIHIVPGISAFQTGACRFGEALTLQEDRLTLMSATDLSAVEEALDYCETLILYKAGGVINELLALLDQRKLLGSSRLISCADQRDDELILASLENWQPQELNYMTTMIIHSGRRLWDETK
jgi:precorrin-2/cobalt-factor-2 C20-methyltransferase